VRYVEPDFLVQQGSGNAVDGDGHGRHAARKDSHVTDSQIRSAIKGSLVPDAALAGKTVTAAR
jgi:hypothetical protein